MRAYDRRLAQAPSVVEFVLLGHRQSCVVRSVGNMLATLPVTKASLIAAHVLGAPVQTSRHIHIQSVKAPVLRCLIRLLKMQKTNTRETLAPDQAVAALARGQVERHF